MKIHIGRNVLAKIESEIKGKSVVVTNERLTSIYGKDHILIPNEKNQSTLDTIHKELFRRGCGRDTTLIAVGGGTILDVAAFAASTYMRGIPLILVPTTLLAMVDASVGGKTGIDTPLGKNLIGSFYLPKAVITDFNLLETLPRDEKINGFFEVLKMGLIYDKSLFQEAITDEVLKRAIQAKLAIVEKDFNESGLRRILNFGHTIGHALEKVGQGLPHGRAVALGCVAESFLSMHLGFLSVSAFENIKAFYQKFALTLPVGYLREKVLEKMKLDKKKKDGKLRCTLIDQIGHAIAFDGEYCYPIDVIDDSALLATLDFLEKNYAN